MSSDSFAFYLSQIREAYKWLNVDSVKDQKQLANGLLKPAIEFLEGWTDGTAILEGYDEDEYQKEVLSKLDAILEVSKAILDAAEPKESVNPMAGVG